MEEIITNINRDTMLHIVTPTKKLGKAGLENSPIAASSLKMCSTKVTDGHFYCIKVDPDLRKTLKDKLNGICKKVLPREPHAIRMEVLRLELKVLEMTSLLKNGIENEPGVRFAICNPLTTIICRFYHYKMKLEETVQTDDEVSGLGGRKGPFNSCYCAGGHG
jgi:hypothetical protein